MEVSARTHHCLGFTFFRDCSTSRSASFSTAGLRTPGSTKSRNKTVTLLEHLEQVAFLRLTSQKLPCSSPPPRSSMCNCGTLLRRNQEYGFLPYEKFPREFLMSSLVDHGMCANCARGMCSSDIPWFHPFLLDLFLGQAAIPSPYSQVSASLFKISQLFVRRENEAWH